MLELLNVSNIQSYIFLLPICWGIYEFRKFRYEINGIHKKIDDISNNRLEEYPFFDNLKTLVDKVNKIVNLS
tara:strand:+ start:87 stop:302 length:216 start_codon:yes stop_codon:yes gene_type:complete